MTSAAPTSSRFTAWLTERERQGVRDLAEQFGTSENYIVRLAVKKVLGMPTPDLKEPDQT